MSATFGLSITRDQMIEEALRTIGKLGASQSVSAFNKARVNNSLNLMLKAWINKGVTLWKIEEITLPLIPAILLYPLGPTAGYLSTLAITITAAGSGGTPGTYALGIADVDGGTGATGTYTIDAGGALSDVTITAPGASYITPVLSFPLGSIVGAAATATVVGLTMDKPLRVLNEGSYIRQPGELDITLTQLGRIDYNTLGQKNPPGSIPTQFFVDPQRAVTNIKFYVPPGSQTTLSAVLVCHMPISDVTGATDTFDFPVEFMNPVKWGLCREIYTEFGVDADTEKRVDKFYAEYVTEAFNFSVEEADMRFSYDNQGNWWGG